jgi:hypothetical protein
MIIIPPTIEQQQAPEMKMRKKSPYREVLTAILAICFAFQFVASAHAWGRLGHRVISRLAMSISKA